MGDGGVLKRVLRPGSGAPPGKGDTVEVHYDGTLLATGAKFDSSRERGKTFKFTLGEGKVIGGWEVGVGSMKPGEMSVLTCAPAYAYGDKGIPPIIPASASLQFEVELLSVKAAAKAASTIAEDNPDAPRTPQSIQAAYDRKMAEMPAKKEGLEGLIEWAKGIYVFGLFSKTAERPPWCRAAPPRCPRPCAVAPPPALEPPACPRPRPHRAPPSTPQVPQPSHHLPRHLRRRRPRLLPGASSAPLARRPPHRRTAWAHVLLAPRRSWRWAASTGARCRWRRMT